MNWLKLSQQFISIFPNQKDKLFILMIDLYLSWIKVWMKICFFSLFLLAFKVKVTGLLSVPTMDLISITKVRLRQGIEFFCNNIVFVGDSDQKEWINLNGSQCGGDRQSPINLDPSTAVIDESLYLKFNGYEVELRAKQDNAYVYSTGHNCKYNQYQVETVNQCD